MSALIKTKTERQKANVTPILIPGVALLLFGACVAFWGVYVTHSRYVGHAARSVTEGPGAYWIGGCIASFGAALCGVRLFKGAAALALWMAFWMVIGLAMWLG